MYFFLSSLVWSLPNPVGLAVVLLALALLAALVRRLRLSAVLSALALVSLSLLWSNLGQQLLSPLEERFKRPDPAPVAVTGIIVLGGGLDGAISLARSKTELGNASDRMVETAILARRYPEARIVISGGSGQGADSYEAEAISGTRLLTDLGVAPERILREANSRNTEENARLTAELVHPDPGETWLLVTSASHMPRAIGLFRKAGLGYLVPWPVDYRTSGPVRFRFGDKRPYETLDEVSNAAHEWVGLFHHWMTGASAQLFPGP